MPLLAGFEGFGHTKVDEKVYQNYTKTSPKVDQN
jgi:hypothetical protein